MPARHFSSIAPRLLTVLLLLLGAACASAPSVVTDFDRTYDFSSIKTIAIQPFDRTQAGTVVVSDMQVARIDEALTAELSRRGFSVVDDPRQADMLLAWHLVTQQRTDVRSFNGATRYNCWNCSAGSQISVRQYTQGTFIVDLVDPVRLRSVWRSTMQSRMRDQPDPQRAAENRREAAQAVFAQFPPGAQGA